MGRFLLGLLVGIAIGAKHKDFVLHYLNLGFDWVIHYMQNSPPPSVG